MPGIFDMRQDLLGTSRLAADVRFHVGVVVGRVRQHGHCFLQPLARLIGLP